MECSKSYCDHSPSIGVRPPILLSVHTFLVNTLASTNINQSVPNLVKMYMTIRSRMSLIMELIGPEMSKLSALELENLPYLTLFTLYHLQILTNHRVFFSSPEHKVLMVSFCDHPMSGVRRPSCVVHNFFKHLLLLIHRANLDETWQGYSLGEDLPKLFKRLNSNHNSG